MKRTIKITVNDNAADIILRLIGFALVIIALHFLDIKKSDSVERMEQRLDSIECILKNNISNNRKHIHY